MLAQTIDGNDDNTVRAIADGNSMKVINELIRDDYIGKEDILDSDDENSRARNDLAEGNQFAMLAQASHLAANADVEETTTTTDGKLLIQSIPDEYNDEDGIVYTSSSSPFLVNGIGLNVKTT